MHSKIVENRMMTLRKSFSVAKFDDCKQGHASVHQIHFLGDFARFSVEWPLSQNFLAVFCYTPIAVISKFVPAMYGALATATTGAVVELAHGLVCL